MSPALIGNVFDSVSIAGIPRGSISLDCVRRKVYGELWFGVCIFEVSGSATLECAACNVIYTYLKCQVFK